MNRLGSAYSLVTGAASEAGDLNAAYLVIREASGCSAGYEVDFDVRSDGLRLLAGRDMPAQTRRLLQDTVLALEPLEVFDDVRATLEQLAGHAQRALTDSLSDPLQPELTLDAVYSTNVIPGPEQLLVVQRYAGSAHLQLR